MSTSADSQSDAYSYDAEGRMLTADGTGAYVYDAFGRRIEKTAGSTGLVYLYDLAGREIGEVNASGANAQGDVYAGSRHLAIYANNSTSFFHSDQLGTERVRTTVSGAVDETCTSLPFGDNQSCTCGEPLGRFAGYERDNEYGLAHAPARYYSPTLGRFMTPDPARGCPTRPQGLNRYVYVVNNPATAVDPSGALPEDPACDPSDPSCPGGRGGVGCSAWNSDDPSDCFVCADCFSGCSAKVDQGLATCKDQAKDSFDKCQTKCSLGAPLLGEVWFLRCTAQCAVASAGAGNPFGHPNADVLERYEQDGVTLWRTDRNGAVTAFSQGSQVTVRPYIRPGS